MSNKQSFRELFLGSLATGYVVLFLPVIYFICTIPATRQNVYDHPMMIVWQIILITGIAYSISRLISQMRTRMQAKKLR
jgi:hypothetical protein